MKNLILTAFVALAVVTTATAQDIDQPGGQGTPPSQPSNQQGNLPVLTPPQGGSVKIEGKVSVRTSNDFVTRAEVEDHVRAGQKPTVVNNYYTNRYYTRPVRRTTTAQKEGNMPTPNITINNNIPAASATSPLTTAKNPNIDGVVKFDPNTFPKGNGDFTVSVGADGSAYMHRDSGGMDFGFWPWLLLGILAILGLVALVRNNGGGGHNHYHNYPQQQPTPQPTPNGGAAPTAPFVQPGPANNGAGHGQGGPNAGGYDARYPNNPGGSGFIPEPVILVMAHPNGSQAQNNLKSEPVVVNVHNHYPTPPTPQPKNDRPPKKEAEAKQ